MQTSFYASGFLYNLRTHKILLLQSKQNEDVPVLWSTMGGDGIDGEEALVAFQRIVNKILNLTIKEKDIYPVYDYFHNTKNKLNYVFYAEVKKSKIFENLALSWFSFSETVKLRFSSQTKQDLVVAQRVINAKWRDDEARAVVQQ